MGVMSSSNFDLSFERVVPITAAQLWQGWTDAKTLMKWFTPAPWQTVDAEIDARPGLGGQITKLWLQANSRDSALNQTG